MCFESVLAMDNAGMVAMFESLVDTGLKVNGVTVEISEHLFAETFELPIEGLTDLSGIPKDLVFDARIIVSLFGEPVSMSMKKKEMTIEFRLLCDILAKTISVKASLKRLATLKIDESYFDKEALICRWAEIDSTRVALNRRTYILAKYRELLIRKFLEARKINFIPSEGSSAIDLKTMAHGLKWEKTCCSKIFEGRPRDPGAIIARTNTKTRSTCWIRTTIRVDGVWVIEPVRVDAQLANLWRVGL
ncbi:pentatricopeptide repeat-containing protein mitochondrial [Dorcoceras hygrometricum]|uniref:Pentatricopeptide repeat-containing protein mitochondrial n=1 Tax=Dorcoceras hygrometricum TaxID=472368 RepID=A0A2Z7CUE8_9LAMI|nr:pentatricopeptide repeat-containing protein mitochondrial [Dorcoceras hygrometricum]